MTRIVSKAAITRYAVNFNTALILREARRAFGILLSKRSVRRQKAKLKAILKDGSGQ